MKAAKTTFLTALTLVLALISGCGNGSHEREVRAAENAAEDAACKARIAAGPQLKSASQISPDEEMKVLAYPGDEWCLSEQLCYVYLNKKLNLARMSCPGGADSKGETEQDGRVGCLGLRGEEEC